MSVTNHDASAYTRMRAQGVLYGYNRALQANKDANAGIVLREQPTYQSLAVVTERKAGSIISQATELNLNSNNFTQPGQWVNNGSNIFSFSPTNINGAGQ